MLSIKEIFSVSLILFSVIDIVGSIPIIVNLRKEVGHVQSEKATVVAGVIMILFLYVGEAILNLFGIDVQSFAVAGALIIFIIGLEMILGIKVFKHKPSVKDTTSIVPIAFPIIAGAGTLTTILSLKAEFSHWNVLIGVAVNLVFRVYSLEDQWLARTKNWRKRN